MEAATNSIVYDETSGFMYCKSDNSQSMNAGIKLLSKQIPKNYALSQADGGDGVIDISDGFLDIEKFHIISNSSIINPEYISDMVAYSGAGPFNIAPGDTVVVGFALIAAPSIYSINTALERASDIYNDVVHPQSVYSEHLLGIDIFPNPASDNFTISTGNTFNGFYTISLINSVGDEVYKTQANADINISISDLAPGLYFVRIKNDTKEFVRKISVLGT